MAISRWIFWAEISDAMFSEEPMRWLPEISPVEHGAKQAFMGLTSRYCTPEIPDLAPQSGQIPGWWLAL